MAACLALAAGCKKAEDTLAEGNDEQGNDGPGSHADLADHIVGTWHCEEEERIETWVFRADGKRPFIARCAVINHRGEQLHAPKPPLRVDQIFIFAFNSDA